MLIVPFQDGVLICNFPSDPRIFLISFRTIEKLFLLPYRSSSFKLNAFLDCVCTIMLGFNFYTNCLAMFVVMDCLQAPSSNGIASL